MEARLSYYPPERTKSGLITHGDIFLMKLHLSPRQGSATTLRSPPRRARSFLLRLQDQDGLPMQRETSFVTLKSDMRKALKTHDHRSGVIGGAYE